MWTDILIKLHRFAVLMVADEDSIYRWPVITVWLLPSGLVKGACWAAIHCGRPFASKGHAPD